MFRQSVCEMIFKGSNGHGWIIKSTYCVFPCRVASSMAFHKRELTEKFRYEINNKFL